MQCLSPLFHSALFSLHSHPVRQFLDEALGLKEVLFFPLFQFQNLLVECCGQTKQKTEKFTVHRCTQVQLESRNWSQRVMADCILWLSGGSRLQTRTNHYIMQPREYFWGDSLEVCVESACVVRVGVCLLQVIQSVPTVQTFAGELVTHDRFVSLWTVLNESNPFWTYTAKSRCRKWMDREKKKKNMRSKQIPPCASASYIVEFHSAPAALPILNLK